MSDKQDKAFNKKGLEALEEVRQDHPTFWALCLVRLANLWEAESLEFSFPSNTIRVAINGVRKGSWLEEFFPRFFAGKCKQTEERLLQLALGQLSLLSEGTLVVALPDEEKKTGRAIQFDTKSAQWGDTTLDDKQILIQFSPEKPEKFLAQHFPEIRKTLERYVCCDKPSVTCQSLIPSYLPATHRFEMADASEKDTEFDLQLGLWALPKAKERGLLLGRSFEGLNSSGISAKELTHGVFRTGLIEPGSSTKSQARAVIALTHHTTPQQSRIVWLANGVEVAQTLASWDAQKLACTCYLPVPESQIGEVRFGDFEESDELIESLEALNTGLPSVLQKMVLEYNAYAPRFDISTLGCWSLLFLAAMAITGSFSSLLGSQLSLGLGVVAGFSLIYAELKYRYHKRYKVGQSLQTLAETWQEREKSEFWKKESQLSGWIQSGSQD